MKHIASLSIHSPFVGEPNTYIDLCKQQVQQRFPPLSAVNWYAKKSFEQNLRQIIESFYRTRGFFNSFYYLSQQLNYNSIMLEGENTDSFTFSFDLQLIPIGIPSNPVKIGNWLHYDIKDKKYLSDSQNPLIGRLSRDGYRNMLCHENVTAHDNKIQLNCPFFISYEKGFFYPNANSFEFSNSKVQRQKINFSITFSNYFRRPAPTTLSRMTYFPEHEIQIESITLNSTIPLTMEEP